MKPHTFLPIYTVAKTSSSIFFLLFFIQTILLITNISAQGNLLITPRRVVFDGKQKTQELNLANNGKDTARYVISFIEIRMNSNGTFEEITLPDSGQHFASPYIRFFPKNVLLAPNEAQAVKVQVIKTDKLVSGEYRSHMYFRAVPKEEPLGEDDKPLKPKTIEVKLTPVFGISIPIIIKSGNDSAKASITKTVVSKDTNGLSKLEFDIIRTGNVSVYGHIKIIHEAVNGTPETIVDMKGVAVYNPTAFRHILVNLPKLKKGDYTNGKIKIIYAANEELNSPILAETILLLQ